MQVEKCHFGELTSLGQKWMHLMDKSDESSKLLKNFKLAPLDFPRLQVPKVLH